MYINISMYQIDADVRIDRVTPTLRWLSAPQKQEII